MNVRLNRLFGTVLLFAGWGAAAETDHPKASADATVTIGNARFTVLTPRVIRMEWSESGQFEDKASLTFVNRRLPVPPYEADVQNGTIRIETQQLKLTYDSSRGRFSAENLSVELNDGSVRWTPGMENKGNLQGTYRTLDRCDGLKEYARKTHKFAGYVDLGEGLVSRDGWVLIDDSERPLFDGSDWSWVQARDHEELDWYFFGCGKNFRQALKDFTAVAGHIPMPPKFAFGVWWSKYWAFTDTEYAEIVQEYENHRLPLDVLVLDMDWHITNRQDWYGDDGKRVVHGGWTGYTWEQAYFPDPGDFLKWTDERGLQTCLNLHPASGISFFESMYPEFAEAMGIDPKSKKRVEFNITDKKYSENYFKHVIHPMEAEGVDFWWLDWQQWNNTEIPGVNPTFYLNYVHFSDMQRQGKRPLIFHRYGGLGNHRYQIGFSGDTYCTWDSLACQPYFTATAANVGYGYWSHDIGGHMRGHETSELYTRWIQWGLYSPVLRTHSTSWASLERRVWAHPYKYFKVMRSALQKRYELFPYIYANVRKTYETGTSLLHPMYYDWPEEDNAYAYTNQYMFGDDLLVSPVTHPIDSNRLFTAQQVWLPKGQWVELDTGTVLNGGQVVERPFMLDEIPIFVRVGAVIPTQKFPEAGLAQVGKNPIGDLILNIYPGADGAAMVYDDEGNNENYQKTAFSKIRIHSRHEGSRQIITVQPCEGHFPGMPDMRSYTVKLHLSAPPASVKVNGQLGECTYDGSSLTASFETGSLPVDRKIDMIVTHSDVDTMSLSGYPGLFKRLAVINSYVNDHRNDWRGSKYLVFKHDLAAAAQTGRRITLNPDRIDNELEDLHQELLPLVESGLRQFAEEHPEKHAWLLDFYNATVRSAAGE